MWLFGKHTDLLGLFIPVWLVWITLFFLPESFLAMEVPLWMWVVAVLLIDVAHVWSTLFRTYLDPEERQLHQRLLQLAPLLSFALLFILAFEFYDWFWRALAYLALYHFIKQQYGFFALYTYKSGGRRKGLWLNDKWVIYMGMVYPVLYWHFHSRMFSWFVSGDFFQFSAPNEWVWTVLSGLYFTILVLWCVQEFYFVKKKGYTFSPGRVMWLVTTALNWYIGIVWFNSDVAFTLTNVIAHGIPYVILVVMYQSTKTHTKKTWYRLGAFIVLGSILLAFGEEFLWDININQERGKFFVWPFSLPDWNPLSRAFWLAMLSLPQVTHYILDGFIWKMNASNPHLKTLFARNG